MRTELTIFILCIIGVIAGCRHTRCNRTILMIDPNGAVTIDYVHIEATSFATDTELDGLVIESDKGEIALNRATSKEDSITVLTPAVVVKTDSNSN